MKFKSIYAVLLGLLASGCSSLVSKVFPLDDLPPPSGPHSVGTQFFEWVDETREELFTDNPDDQRRLSGQVWYPTAATSEVARQPYLDFPGRRLDMVAYQSGLPRFLIAHMQRVKTNAVLNAPFLALDQKMPLRIRTPYKQRCWPATALQSLVWTTPMMLT